MNEEEIFQVAATLPAAERAAYLLTACEGQPALRQRIERLLASHDHDAFMQRPADRTDSAELEAELARLKPEEGEDRIGNYKLLQKIGEGGFGTVWMAEQLEPVRRRVALKIIKPGMDTKEVIMRFEQERQALALMDHPNIAKVLDAGVTPLGRPFFVMELVRGIRITDFCDQNNLSTRERLDLFIAVCNAIQHAHQKGIIHRDIKPSNILVTLHDGVPVPKVIDFGVAKAIQSQRLTDLTFFTRFEQMIGTPLYMSPEQAEMSGLDIDTRSDIYSLGVLLYELLTGTTPFDAKELMALGIDAMRKTIRETEPVRPSTKLSQTLVAANVSSLKSPDGKPPTDAEVRADSRRLLRVKETINLLKGDLDWIVMKCLEKDRSRRYDTANGLAMDIQRHLNNEPVLACSPSATYKLRKFIRRNRSAVLAAAALLLVVCLGLVGTSLGLLWANREAGRARLAELDATDQRDAALAAREREAQLLYSSDMDRAQQAWEDNNVGLVLALLERHRARKRPGDFEWYYLWRLCKRSRLTPAIETTSPALAVALSPDGKTVACGGMDGQVVLIDATTHRMRKLGAHSSQVLSIAFSPDGKRLASGSGDRTVRLWDVGTGQHQPITEFTDWVQSVAFSPDGSRLVVGSLDGQVGLWNVAAQKFEWRSEDARYVWSVAFSPGGTIVASASAGFPAPGVKLRDAVTGHVLHHVPAHDVKAGVISFSPDGGSLATGGHDGIVRLWNLELKEPRELKGHTSGIRSLIYLDRDTLASGSSDNTVRLWDLATGKLRDTLKGHSGAVGGVACSTDGKLLISASSDHTVKLWQLNWQQERSVLEQHEEGIWSVALSPDGSIVASGSVDGTVKLSDAATGELKFDLKGHSDCVTCIAFSPDRKTLASSGDDRTIVLWDTATGEVRRRLTGHTDTVWSLAFLEGGLTLASAGEDRTVRLWSVATGEGRTLVKQSDKIGCLSVWQDQVLAFGGWDDYVIEVWDLHGRGQLAALRGHLGPVKAMAVMSSGRELITGSWDGTVRLWDLESDERSEILTRHTDSIDAVAVSPDSTTLAFGGMDGTVKLLDLTTRRERAALKGHKGLVRSLAFSQDGKLLVSGGADRTVRLWRAASDEEVVEASVSPMPLR